ncbi:hypothetical protein GWI33_001639 [Rhynchophorus ferrugineus]|uniref:Uncharacterized protein n=1 Tax=Rhynchophorus ferrugineus TaxID=354439 RepID=A0A834MG84_RHYFE|nr:hypothetical protein GWI33_001639 [Rhynchophorus ferrugineus]
MSTTTLSTEDKEVQTVVRVFPFILEATDTRASARSEKKFCTVLSLETNKENKAFYSLLQYCPFSEIQKDSIRVLDLPRKTKLTFLKHYRFSADELRILSLADDDGVAEYCVDMLTRMVAGQLTSYRETDTQTDVMVSMVSCSSRK